MSKEKKAPMVHVNLRITQKTLEYFRRFEKPTQKMREVLERWVDYGAV